MAVATGHYLALQLDALRDLLAVTEPVTRAAFTHLQGAHDTASLAARNGADPTAPAERVYQQVVAVGHEVVRADEDVRLADVAVDRAHGAASRTASLARELRDPSQTRLAAQQRRLPGGSPAAGGPPSR